MEYDDALFFSMFIAMAITLLAIGLYENAGLTILLITSVGGICILAKFIQAIATRMGY